MPAQAAPSSGDAFVFGQGRMDSRLRGNDGYYRNHGHVDGVIPAKAGIHANFEPILPMNSLHDHGCSEGVGYMFG